jgi:hypothetical protein
VNDCVKRPQSVHLVGHIASCLDTRQVTDYDSFRAGHLGAGNVSPLLIPGVKDHFVPCGDQKLGSHLSEAVG